MSQHHRLDATPDTVVWGYLDAALPPVLTVASGDTVTVRAWNAGTAAELPPDRSVVDPAHLEVIDTVPKGPGNHKLTGPVAVAGAAPGDVLQVDILDVMPIEDWAFMAIRPLRGTLPAEFDETHTAHARIERVGNAGAGIAHMPWGLDIEIDPFFGILAVAPPPHWGSCTSVQPRAFGGNMDLKELRAGSTLYLPVFNDGALFYAGDGHSRQGDGEVCLTALETSMEGTFRLTVRKDLDYTKPFAETETHLIAIGLDEDLDEAARKAVREMIAHVQRRTGLARHEAYMLCSLAGDLHVTQTVDGVKGCHMMLAKAHL